MNAIVLVAMTLVGCGTAVYRGRSIDGGMVDGWTVDGFADPDSQVLDAEVPDTIEPDALDTMPDVSGDDLLEQSLNPDVVDPVDVVDVDPHNPGWDGIACETAATCPQPHDVLGHPFGVPDCVGGWCIVRCPTGQCMQTFVCAADGVCR